MELFGRSVVETSNFEKVGTIEFGDMSAYLNDVPFDWQKLEVGDILRATRNGEVRRFRVIAVSRDHQTIDLAPLPMEPPIDTPELSKE